MRINRTVGNVSIKINTKRIDNNLREAHKKLNEQIVADCTPLIPFEGGDLSEKVEYPEGIYGDVISWGGKAIGVPYAHYQYVGEIYGPNIPQYDSAGNLIGWKSPKHKKPTGRPLQYHTPGTTGEWFEVAKRQNLQSWVKLVKETSGKE